ncbi:MAG: tRNA threonylcarbamoyladenosine biosynthesis protein RimN [Gammaproteobacteria bacterium]|nr:tRNA threonylcarbamoyladenosine biosynthesis protein RimN [Gammaproteobacteria bacterium]
MRVESTWRLREAARCFHSGGLIAYPTEAVYGLGCDPLDAQAVYRLLALKQRPVEKGLILIAADYQQLAPFVAPIDEDRLQTALDSWPGPNTWLLPAADGVPRWLTGNHDTLAVRVTAHPLAAALSRVCESPLVSTSANEAGQPPFRGALGVRLRFRAGLDLVVSGAVGGDGAPSRIRDLLTGSVIRP